RLPLEQPRVLDRGGDDGGEGEDGEAVFFGPGVDVLGVDLQHTDGCALGDQGYAEVAAHAGRGGSTARHIGFAVDVRDVARLAARNDTAADAVPDRDACFVRIGCRLRVGSGEPDVL